MLRRGKRFGEAAVSVARAQRGVDARLVRVSTATARAWTSPTAPDSGTVRGRADGQPLSIDGDGQKTRSMTYVDDLVDAEYGLWRGPTSASRPRSLGAGDQRYSTEVVRMVADIVASRVSPSVVRRCPGDPCRRNPSSMSRARSAGRREPCGRRSARYDRATR